MFELVSFSKVPLSQLKTLFLVVLILLTSACAQVKVNDDGSLLTDQAIPIKLYPVLQTSPGLISKDEIFQLTTKQKKDFLTYLQAYENRKTPKHQKVSDYLQRVIQGFSFNSETLLATKALEEKRGNCLSLAMLTTSLARLANVSVGYELMETPPVYDKKGNTILKSEHVRSLLFSHRESRINGYTSVFRPVIRIDYFTIGRSKVERQVTEPQFIAMYYRNKAAEAIVENRLTDAFALVSKSLEFTNKNAQAVNMLALIYERLGFQKDAEAMYQYGIRYSRDQLELLSNYRKFLIGQQRHAEAKLVMEQIIQSDEQNPFDWLSLGDESLHSDNYAEAVYYYNKVIEIAPYLHYGYFGRARAEFLKGNTHRASNDFNRAKKLAQDDGTRAFYESKLVALTAYVNK